MDGKRLGEEGVKKNMPTVSNYVALLRALKRLTEEEFFKLASGKGQNVGPSAFCRLPLVEKYKAEDPSDKRPDSSIFNWINHEIDRLRGVLQPAIPCVMRKKNPDLVAEWTAMVEEISEIYKTFRATVPQEHEEPENMERQNRGEQQQHGVEDVSAPDRNNAHKAHNDICGQYTSISKSCAFDAVNPPADGIVPENETDYETKYGAESSGAKARDLEKSISVVVEERPQAFLGCKEFEEKKEGSDCDMRGEKRGMTMVPTNVENDLHVKDTHRHAPTGEFSEEESRNTEAMNCKSPGNKTVKSVVNAVEKDCFGSPIPPYPNPDVTLKPHSVEKQYTSISKSCAFDAVHLPADGIVPENETNYVEDAANKEKNDLEMTLTVDTLRSEDVSSEQTTGRSDANGQKAASAKAAAIGSRESAAPSIPESVRNDVHKSHHVDFTKQFTTLSKTCGFEAVHPPYDRLVLENETKYETDYRTEPSEKARDLEKSISVDAEVRLRPFLCCKEPEEKKEGSDCDMRGEKRGLTMVPTNVENDLQAKDTHRHAPTGEFSEEETKKTEAIVCQIPRNKDVKGVVNAVQKDCFGSPVPPFPNRINFKPYFIEKQYTSIFKPCAFDDVHLPAEVPKLESGMHEGEKPGDRQDELDALREKNETLSSELNGLRERLSDVDELKERVSKLEAVIEELMKKNRYFSIQFSRNFAFNDDAM